MKVFELKINEFNFIGQKGMKYISEGLKTMKNELSHLKIEISCQNNLEA